MSKVIKWQFSDFFDSRREKLVNMLLSEIIFLKSHIRCIQDTSISEDLEIGLIKLEFILNALKKSDSEITDTDYDKTTLLVYNIFKEITDKLEN